MTETIPTAPTAATRPSAKTEVRALKLNHPKNYLAHPLAVAADADTATLLRKHAVALPQRIRRGARELDLITDTNELSPLGEAVVATGYREFGGVKDTLADIQTLKYSQTRFVDERPVWRSVCERVAFAYEPTQIMVEILREQGGLSLAALTRTVYQYDSSIATTLFLHPTEVKQTYENSAPAHSKLCNSVMYRSEVPFQFKAFLYHCGILTTRGGDTNSLNPETDYWELTDVFA